MDKVLRAFAGLPAWMRKLKSKSSPFYKAIKKLSVTLTVKAVWLYREHIT